MSFDCSRFTYHPWTDFLGVVMQQGRVQLDADWNELVAQLIRRIQAGALDTFAQSPLKRAVVPRATPNGFKIEAQGGKLKIGVGRMYVDGILAENHGTGTRSWDASLAEEFGTAYDYAAQPYYYSSPPDLPTGGPHLVYLDVWQRELTYLHAPEPDKVAGHQVELVEKAVGVDSTARLQTVWQVKVLPNVGAITCATDDDEIPGWLTATQPSAGRLSTKTGDVEDTPDPCQIPPSGGYKGRENQLYRVEIHTKGLAQTATFKWSRDNGSVQTRVGKINTARDRIVVDSIGRDSVLRFSDGDWIEITDDERELRGDPGIMARIKLGGGVDDATRSIALAQPLPAGAFPTNAADETTPDRHTRIRRWDQRGKVLREDGSVYVDLDTAATGVILVPPVGTWLLLEDGVLVSFERAGTQGDFHVADHWSFAARTADASVEKLTKAPPLGVHHHYARLAVVNFPDTESDCRVMWPPSFTSAGECGCDVCVTAEGHSSGSGTIQQAIDQVVQTGGVVCLGAGTYRLSKPLRIDNGRSVTLRGKGFATVLVPESEGSAIQVSGGLGVTIENLAVTGLAARDDRRALIHASNTANLTLHRLYLLTLAQANLESAAIQLAGYALDTRISECALLADVGVLAGADDGDLALTAKLTIEDNLLVGLQRGIAFGPRALHFTDTHLANNLLLGGADAAISVLGGVLPGSPFYVRDNTVWTNGDGIRAGVDQLHLLDNAIQGIGRAASGAGVIVMRGLAQAGVDRLWILGNQIANVGGPAIEIRAPLGSAMIKNNTLEQAQAGIVFTEHGSAERLSIENNHLWRIAENENPAAGAVVAIEVVSAKQVDIAGNVVDRFAEGSLQASSRAAIRVAASENVRISANRLSALGVTTEHAGYCVGIELQGPFVQAIISENLLTRAEAPGLVPASWSAIRAGTLGSENHVNFGSLVLDASYLLTAKRVAKLAVARSAGLGIRGNQASAARIVGRLVLAAGARSCAFSDNQLEASPSPTGAQSDALVLLSADTLVAANNQVRWIEGDFDAINILKTRAFTVLGNITHGRIRVDTTSDLPVTWQPLNVLA